MDIHSGSMSHGLRDDRQQQGLTVRQTNHSSVYPAGTRRAPGAQPETVYKSSAKTPAKSLTVVAQLEQMYARLRVILTYLSDDIRRGPIQFKIAIFSVFLIITFISILINARALMTAMYIGMAEAAVGDADFYITAISSSANTFGVGNSFYDRLTSNFLNVSQTHEKLQNVPDLVGSSPRWILPGTVLHPDDSTLNTTVFGVLGDSLQEEGIGVGRALKAGILAPDEAIIMSSVRNMAELGAKNSFRFRLDLLRYLRSANLINDTSTTNLTDRQYLKNLLGTGLPLNITLTPPNITQQLINSGVPAANVAGLSNASNPINISLDAIVNPVLDSLLQILNFERTMTIKRSVDRSLGKWPDALGNVVFMDMNYFLSDFSKKFNSTMEDLSYLVAAAVMGSNNSVPRPNQTLANPLTDTAGFVNQQMGIFVRNQLSNLFILPITQGFNNLNVTGLAMGMSAVLKDKMTIYSSFTGYQKTLIQISNRVSRALGDVSRYAITSPMYLGYYGLGFVAIFINNIIYMILVLLAILSVVLLASLMVFSIDEKSYEFGMLRALGFERNNLIAMLAIQGGIFAVSGWCFGVLFSWVISMVLQIYFYLDIRMLTDIKFDDLAWVVSIGFGLLLPVVVNLYSIRSSLTQSLRDSLDLYHRSIGTMTVIFVKLAQLGISQSLFVLSIELSVYGFLFYYVAPLLFFYNRFDLFIYLFNTVLLATVVSLTILANILQPYLETGFLWLCSLFLGKNKPLKTVVAKNLEAHRPSNRKTSLMLALCVCFIIFSGSGIHTQVNSLISQLIIFNGADITANTPSLSLALDEAGLRKVLGQDKIKNLVESYSFVAKSLRNYPYVTKIELSPKAYYPVIPAIVTGIDENYTKTMYYQYYTPDQYNSSAKYSTLPNGVRDGISAIFEGLSDIEQISVDPKGVYSGAQETEALSTTSLGMKAVIPTGLSDLVAIKVGVPGRLKVTFDKDIITANMTVVHTASKVPGMQFSKYTLTIATNHDILVPMKSYAQVLESYKKLMALRPADKQQVFNGWQTERVQLSTYGVPKYKLLVRMKEGTTSEDRDIVKNGIKNMLSSSDVISDAVQLSETAQQSLSYLSLLNIIIALLTCTIAFFMLLISLMKKIKDNIWELGVLRSMGVSTKQVFIVYFIETGGVIISSLILGTGVGLIVSAVSTVFFYTFFEINLGLGFPVPEFLSLLGFLLVTTVLTSWMGIRSFIYLPIAKLLKGLV